MQFFKYQGLAGDGRNISGRVAARNREAAIKDLRSRQVDVVEIREMEAGNARKLRTGRPKTEDYAQVIEQLDVLSAAGVNIMEAVDTIGEMAPNEQVRRELAAISQKLRQGHPLSTAMEAEMPALPRYVPNLLRMAEVTGKFPQVAGMISSQMTSAEALRQEMKSALNYPLFLISVGFAAVSFIFYFVVPRFAGMVAGQEDKLPGFTRAVFDSGVWFKDNIGIFFLGLAIAVFLSVALMRVQSVADAVSRFLDSAPIIGQFRKLSEEGGWLRVLGLSTQSGARLLDALELATNASVAPVRQHLYRELQQNIRSGLSLTHAVQLNLDLDPIAVNLIRTGEKASRLPDMLLSAAEIYQKRLSARSRQLTDLAEPLAILLISFIVGGVVVSLVTAMTSIYDIAI